VSQALAGNRDAPGSFRSPLGERYADVSEETQRLIDEEVRRIVEAAHSEVTALLREQCHRRLSTLLDRLSQWQTEAGLLDAATDTVARWVGHDRWNETAHRRLMQLYFTVGDRAAALRAYEACRVIFREELDVQPDRDTEALAQRLRAQAPDRSSVGFQQYAVMDTPIEPPLVGRADEHARLVRGFKLASEGHPQLTALWGEAGIGKTRLALQMAMELINDFADGVFFVSLAPIRDPAFVAPTVAHIFGLREVKNQSLLDLLTAYLQYKHLLLLLDNFEQILPAAALLAQLLAACPQLKVLVTSREVLRLRSEQQFPVPSLALPDPKHLPDIEALSHYAAVALFIQRAKAVKPDFALTQANAGVITKICANLDGLPLAIELAAARMKLLSPQALLVRVVTPLDPASNSSAGLPRLISIGRGERFDQKGGAIQWLHQPEANLPRVLLGSVAGVFVDRWDRRWTMIISNLLLALGLLPMLAVHSKDTLWIVYIVAFCESCFDQFVSPAESALIPNLVREEHLVSANALKSIGMNSSRLIGGGSRVS